MKQIKTPEIDQLFEAILSLKTDDDCYAFFGDVCTIKEVLEMAQRFQVAKMLQSGMSYVDVSEKSGVSSATISRVNRCLKYSDGYIRAFKYMQTGSDNGDK